MLLSDNEIRNLANDLIEGFDDSRLGSISYDLETEDFCIGNGVRSITLKPLDSVFVRSKEKIKLPNDLIARVVLRNSRLRQGIALDAPVYQPGHRTRVFFRITNFSNRPITLANSKGIASAEIHILLGTAGLHDAKYQ